ncbi:MAG TPA: (4Fe-4S)-binding protein [Kribbellaceae bacterium]
MRVVADTDVCIGAGQCVLAAPGVFDQGHDGIVVLRDGDPAGTPAAVLEAVALCPSGAIRLAEDVRS